MALQDLKIDSIPAGMQIHRRLHLQNPESVHLLSDAQCLNCRWSACDTGLKLENAPVLYQEQTLANLPKHPYRQVRKARP